MALSSSTNFGWQISCPDEKCEENSVIMNSILVAMNTKCSRKKVLVEGDYFKLSSYFYCQLSRQKLVFYIALAIIGKGYYLIRFSINFLSIQKIYIILA